MLPIVAAGEFAQICTNNKKWIVIANSLGTSRVSTTRDLEPVQRCGSNRCNLRLMLRGPISPTM